MKVYSVYMSGNTSENAVEVFTSKELMNKYIEDDIKEVARILAEDGYEAVIQKNNFASEVYAKDTNIYYSWEIFESTLREDNYIEKWQKI